MDHYQLVLNKCKELIINDIRGDIYELFKSRHFITEDEFDFINDPQCSIDRNKRFFEILLRIMDQNIFEQFLSMLEENYWWIAKDLHENGLENEAVLNANRRFIEENRPSDPYYRQLEIEKQLEMKSEEVLKRGATPLHQLSNLYISRSEMEEKLKKEIIDLKPGKFLVLHGMPGSGKSSLAMKVLKDYELVFNNLQGNVFWLFELKTVEKILHELFGLISDDGILHGEIEPTNLHTQITKLIKNKKLEDALIVFDDVVADGFIKYLNFNCKKLIISHHDNIVNWAPSKEVKQLKIDYFLSEKEGQKLFASASGIQVSELPDEAKEIIRLTKGFPFLMHFIARQIQRNREALKNGLWENITEILRRERHGKEDGRSIESFLKKLYNVFDSLLEKLTSEMQRYYEMLAVFPSDINLNTKVFSTIWSMNEIEAILKLDEFENISLIGKMHLHNKGYVYGIHDVLLYYLRNRKKDNLKELHNELSI
ncbi:hypothetical protein LSTR_LSTR004138 [Laodelphax striatellus]|uniref:Uncharacterized protein n=1 Tax=Laodelphax striatellus TaxID=195883 RepID=A0A482WHA5_LAOST|nr:hypothetical protein LSTR_LSTR004138 [Laodelphax striatellus]